MRPAQKIDDGGVAEYERWLARELNYVALVEQDLERYRQMEGPFATFMAERAAKSVEGGREHVARLRRMIKDAKRSRWERNH